MTIDRVRVWLGCLGLAAGLAGCSEPARVVRYAGGGSWSEIRFDDGQPDGEWKTWFESGQLESLQTFDGGVRDGPVQCWYEDGRPRLDGSYLQGQQDGAWTSWYPNGAIERQREFLAGQPHGRWFWYYESGQLRRSANYVLGRLQGETLLQAPDGMRLRKGVIEADGTERWTQWSPRGVKLREVVLREGSLDGPCSFWTEDGELDLERTGIYCHGKRLGDIDAPSASN